MWLLTTNFTTPKSTQKLYKIHFCKKLCKIYFCNKKSNLTFLAGLSTKAKITPIGLLPLVQINGLITLVGCSSRSSFIKWYREAKFGGGGGKGGGAVKDAEEEGSSLWRSSTQMEEDISVLQPDQHAARRNFGCATLRSNIVGCIVHDLCDIMCSLCGFQWSST